MAELQGHRKDLCIFQGVTEKQHEEGLSDTPFPYSVFEHMDDVDAGPLIGTPPI